MEQAYCKLPACNEQRVCCRKGACCILSPLPFSESELHTQNPANKWPNTPSSQMSLCKCYDSSLLVGPPTELICRGKENLSRVKFKLYKHLPEFLSAWGFAGKTCLFGQVLPLLWEWPWYKFLCSTAFRRESWSGFLETSLLWSRQQQTILTKSLFFFCSDSP